MLTDEQIKDEASHHGFIGSTEMLVKFARAIEAEASAQDTALIRQLVSEIDGMRLAAGYDTYGRPNWDDLEPALKAARSRLLDSDLSKLTDRGAKAWAGVDAQKLREGEVP